MSALQHIRTQLDIYNNFAFHQNPNLAHALAQVQAWQKKRMASLHQTLFAQPNHQAIGQYFLQRLYAGPDFDVLAKQFDKMLTKLSKIESLVPDSVIATGVLGIELAVTAIALDLALAQYIIDTNGTADASTPLQLTDSMVIHAITANNQQVVRKAHLHLLTQLGEKLDQYMRSFVVKTAFKMAKNKAYDKGFTPLYDFTAEGFSAMKELKSTADFIAQFVAAEVQYLSDLHA